MTRQVDGHRRIIGFQVLIDVAPEGMIVESTVHEQDNLGSRARDLDAGRNLVMERSVLHFDKRHGGLHPSR